MTLHECPRCHRMLPSHQAASYHLIGAERCYTDGEEIADRLHSRIDTLKGQVEFLLIRYPGTRGDDAMLTGWHQVFFQHTHYYDVATQAFHEKQGARLKDIKYKVKEGSLSRLRRFIQREDKLTYHNEDGSFRQQHLCLLASRQVQLVRAIEQDESRKQWR